MEQTSFHQENFRRRTRYTAVFLILAAVFCVVTVLNINTGNVHIPVPKILRILFLKEGAATEYNIIWKIRLPRILMAALLGGALSLSGFLLQTFFFQSYCRTFRSRNFFRSENGRGTYNDRVFEIYRKIFFVYTDSCSIYRVADLDGIYPSDVEKSAAYGISSCRRNHDRIYLFGYHGFCCNLCG